MFKVKIDTKEDLINGLTMLNEIGALGTEICIGTYMPDADKLDDILSLENDYFEDREMKYIDICVDKNEFRNSNFPNQYGKSYLNVGIVTQHDLDEGDFFERTVSFENMITETNKLIS